MEPKDNTPEAAAKDTPAKAKGKAAIGAVTVLGVPADTTVEAGSLIIACSTPGFARAGMEHPRLAIHPVGTFTEAQILMLAKEPKLVVVRVA